MNSLEAVRSWYDGAHKLAHGLAEKHGTHVASAAGVIAGLSPQNDWDMNVHQAHVVMDTMTNHQHTAWSPEMTKHANKIWGKAKDPKIKNMVGSIQGKTLNQIEQEGGKDMHLRQAVWIRAHNEAHGSKHYREVKPDGSLGDFFLMLDFDLRPRVYFVLGLYISYNNTNNNRMVQRQIAELACGES
jgi:hypothetical protein